MALYDLASTNSVALNMSVKREDIQTSRYPSILEVFDANHSFLLSELCGIMLATSDNPAAQYILDLVGISNVNAFLADRQCNDTRMVVGYRDYELSSPLARSNYSSAHDMANLLSIAYSERRYNPLLKSLTNGLRKSRIPLRLPEDLPVANKTGTLDGVVDDAAIIYGNNYDLSITILADAEENEPLTENEIADFVTTVWKSLGERLDERGEQ
jgi:beta-lactamase class A